MENLLNLINEKQLIKNGEIVAVACSGGADSMVLLHKLKSLQKELNIEVIAITVDHSIRENGKRDADFVEKFCKNNNIRCYKFKIDVPKIAKDMAISLESAGRQARYKIFDAIIHKGIADKIALAHHVQDQAETIMLHLLRGSGLTGVRGMEFKKDSYYIRPFLNISKQSILNYAQENQIEFVEDETNAESIYTRNYLRNEVIPVILKKWPNFASSLLNFSKAVIEDDDFINNHLNDDAMLIEDKIAKIPLNYFNYADAQINRIIFKALHGIGINVDIERKHINKIKELATTLENGKRINLPLGVTVYKEYEYITLISKVVERQQFFEEFKKGQIVVPNYGKLSVKRVKEVNNYSSALYIDEKQIPQNAVWRYRKEGDVFEKFGGGTKKLKRFLIDKKIPQRERDLIPVLAVGNDILVVAGLEISNKVRVNEQSKSIIKIELLKENNKKIG